MPNIVIGSGLILVQCPVADRAECVPTHQGFVRRIETKPDAVPELALELFALRQFESPCQVGLDVVGLSPTVDITH